MAEQIGIDRAKELFGAEHANLQPHSGASANIAVYGAFLQPGDTVLAMSLPHGGHLTHGTKVSFSGKWFNAVHYGVAKDTEDIDYDQARDLAREHRPKMIICGGSAIPRLIDFAAFREIADEVGAILMVDAAHFIGLVAGGAIPSPVPYADVVTFTTHKVLRGPRGGMLVCKEEHAAKLDKAVFPMMQGGPLMHAVAAKAVALKEAATPAYRDYARQVIANSQALTDALAAEGMRPVTGGTDTHLALLDLQGIDVTGQQAEQRCAAAGIVLNKNAIPYDPQPPSVASGIRVGTPSRHHAGHGGDRHEGDRRPDRQGRQGRVRYGGSGDPRRCGRARGRPPGLRPLAQPCARVPARPVRGRRGDLAADAGGADARDPDRRDGRPARPRRARHPDARGWAAWRCTSGSAPRFAVAHSLPSLSAIFKYSDVQAVLVAGGIITLVGLVDDRWQLDAITKLAGQTVAAGVLVLLGLQLVTVTLPGRRRDQPRARTACR